MLGIYLYARMKYSFFYFQHYTTTVTEPLPAISRSALDDDPCLTLTRRPSSLLMIQLIDKIGNIVVPQA